jgi:hypothetical protein
MERRGGGDAGGNLLLTSDVDRDWNADGQESGLARVL